MPTHLPQIMADDKGWSLIKYISAGRTLVHMTLIEMNCMSVQAPDRLPSLILPHALSFPIIHLGESSSVPKRLVNVLTLNLHN